MIEAPLFLAYAGLGMRIMLIDDDWVDPSLVGKCDLATGEVAHEWREAATTGAFGAAPRRIGTGSTVSVPFPC